MRKRGSHILQEMERELQEEIMMRRDKEVRDVREERLFQVRRDKEVRDVREERLFQVRRDMEVRDVSADGHLPGG